MGKTNTQRRNRLYAGGIGLATTGVVLLFYALGWLTPLERVALDLRLRYLCQPPVAADQIVVVGIDDPALARWGEWPWNRTRTAGLVGLLHDLGAKAIAIDLLFDRPKAPRVDLPELDVDHDLEPRLARDRTLSVDPVTGIAFDDEALAKTIARCGNVILAMDFPLTREKTEFHPPPYKPIRIQAFHYRSAFVKELMKQGCVLSPDDLLAAYKSLRPVTDSEAAKIKKQLEDGDLYWSTLRLAAQDWAAEAFHKNPAISFDEFAERLTGQTDHSGIKKQKAPTTQSQPIAETPTQVQPVTDSFVRKELGLAFRRAKSLRELQRFLIEPAGREVDWLARVSADQVTPPLPNLVKSAAGVGFVGYGSSFGDSVFRDVPLVARGEKGRLYPALSLAVAVRLFDLYQDGVSFGQDVWGREIIIRRMVCHAHPTAEDISKNATSQGRPPPGPLPEGGPPPYPPPGGEGGLLIPVDEHGNLLVAWPQAKQWSQALPTVSVGQFMALLRDRELMVQNVRVLRVATAAVLEAFSGPVDRYERVIRALDALELAGQTAPALTAELAGFPQEQPPAKQVEWLQAEARKLETQADRTGQSQESDLVEGLKIPDLTAAERGKYQGQLDLIRKFQAAQAALTANQQLGEQIKEAEKTLAPRVAGKVVFLGSTATGAVASDMIASPAYPTQTPGVIVHASVFNQLLTGFFLRWPVGWMDGLFILASGVLVTLLAVRLGPVASGAAAAGLLLAALAIAAGAFYYGRMWVTASGPAAAVALGYLTVTTWKLRTEGRQRRLYADYFSQYTDPVLARQIAEDFSLIERVEEREITVFFTDLAGFTPISERLGGQKTQQVLNTYFERMGQVLRQSGAMINKYLGDGMMVFYNPVVNPQPDHAWRALASVLECQRAVKALNAEQKPLDPDWPDLKMRVGVNTGRAIVGNLGSKDKTDYTCISDIVNLAARLEPANKAFGTEILIGGATAQIIGADYLCRPLGKLRAVGKEGLVDIFEPRGRVAEADEADRRHVADWAAALELFYARKWEEAAQRWEQIRERHPDDAAAGIYLGLCMTYEAEPPAETWQGEYVQTSK